MLRVNFSFARILRVTCASLAMGTAAWCGDGTVVPLTVCEIVHDLPALDGKVVAAIGRYSFRSDGRSMNEQTCETAGEQPELWLVEDVKDGPRPPEHLNLDSVALKKKFTDVQRRSTLGKFKFGTSDYDRWAIVYGRVERRTDDTKKAPANLVFRGSSVIIVITPGEW